MLKASCGRGGWRRQPGRGRAEPQMGASGMQCPIALDNPRLCPLLRMEGAKESEGVSEVPPKDYDFQEQRQFL